MCKILWFGSHCRMKVYLINLLHILSNYINWSIRCKVYFFIEILSTDLFGGGASIPLGMLLGVTILSNVANKKHCITTDNNMVPYFWSCSGLRHYLWWTTWTASITVANGGLQWVVYWSYYNNVIMMISIDMTSTNNDKAD